MHTSVRSCFVKFNEPIERRVAHMYLDVKGLVTVGIGNLYDVERTGDTAGLKKVMEELVTLPFVYKDTGMPASKADIEADWKKVKKKQEWAKLKLDVMLTKFDDETDLRLSNQAIDTLVLKKADAMERELKRDPAFWDFDQWPADAQLGLLSMAWALGTTKLRTGWPNFKAACRKQDFDDAAQRCGILTAGNPGVIPRNHADQRLFKNAAAVLANDGRNPVQNRMLRMTLHYPGMMMKPMVIRGVG